MAKRPRVQVEPIDTGPPERTQHNKVVIERDVHNRPRLRVLDQIELDRLLLQRKLSIEQHNAGEHLYALITQVGYFPTCKWALDSNIRGDSHSISQAKAEAYIRIGLSTAWLRAKVGENTQRFLWSVVLGERKVPDRALPPLRHALDSFASFEAWSYGRDFSCSLPLLLADMPRRVQAKHPGSLCHQE